MCDIPVYAPRLDLDACRSEYEKRVAETLQRRAEQADIWLEVWLFEGSPIVVSMDAVSERHAGTLATYRADFQGEFVLLGEDPCAGSLACDLDASDCHVQTVRGTPEEQADAAADWLITLYRATPRELLDSPASPDPEPTFPGTLPARQRPTAARYDLTRPFRSHPWLLLWLLVGVVLVLRGC